MSKPQFPPTRPSLLMRLRTGDDRTAREQFVEIYYPRIRNWCKRRGLQEADVDDVSQGLVLKLYDEMKRFVYDPKVGKFRGWLKRVTDNVLNEFFARRKKWILGGENIFDESDAERVTEYEKGVAEARGELEAEIDKGTQLALLDEAKVLARQRVEPESWQIFEMLNEQKLTPKEVAEKMGISRARVDWTKCRIQALLKKIIEELAGDGNFNRSSES